jgi:hypothetical protein
MTKANKEEWQCLQIIVTSRGHSVQQRIDFRKNAYLLVNHPRNEVASGWPEEPAT